MTGRDGGRDIDLRQFAREGMRLYGLLQDADGPLIRFDDKLESRLDDADKIYNGINEAIDKYIEGKRLSAPPPSVYTPVWKPDTPGTSLNLSESEINVDHLVHRVPPRFGWLDAPAFNGLGQPKHYRGVTDVSGVYFLGLPWLHTWGSGRFSGIARDAAYVVDQIAAVQQDSCAASLVAQ